MARTYQKPLSKCQAEKNATTSKQIHQTKEKNKYKRENLIVTKTPMLKVFISAKNWATNAMYFHQQKTSSKLKYSDDGTQECQTCRNRKYSTFKVSLLRFLNTKIQIMTKIVVVKKMHIWDILFSVLFHHLNQFHIIYKTPLQALANSVTASFPLTEHWTEQLPCLFSLITVPAVFDSSLYLSRHTPGSWNTFSCI